MIRWAHPQALHLLWLLIPILWFMIREIQRQNRLIRGFPRFRTIVPGYSLFRKYFRMLLLITAAALLFIATAGPQIGTRLEERTREGVDIVLAIDVSRSMAAQDITPSRLGKARHATQSFIRMLRGDRVGLMPFAGEPYTLFPLTSDYGAAMMFVDALQVDFIPLPGTELAPVIRQAQGMYDPESDAARVLIILTDGEDFGEGVEDAIREAVDEGLRIYTIGIGTRDGAPIPILDEDGNPAGYKKDRQGNIVLSRLEEGVLADMAQLSGGKYYLVTPNESELIEIYKDIYDLEKGKLTTQVFTDYEPRYQWFLILALLFWGWHLLLPEHKKTRMEDTV